MQSSNMVVSLVQAPVVKGQIEQNLQMHLSYIAKSANQGADLVVFPELSLTGYEMAMVSELALTKGAVEFATLSNAAVVNQIVVVAGCPLAGDTDLPTIGAVICFPDGRIDYYAKQYLHPGEDTFCASGEQDYRFYVKNHHLALAICADFADSRHSQRAHQDKVDAYIVSALISDKGYSADADILSGIAAQHAFPVLLCNHISITGGWPACGNNSVWGADGGLVVASGNKESGFVLVTLNGDQVYSSVKSLSR